MEKKDGSDNLLLVPCVFIAAGSAMGIGRTVLQWLGYESSQLSDILLILAGFLVVILARNKLISFQKSLTEQ